MTLGEKLLQLRKKEGLSQEEVADKLNVSRQTVSKWETDQSVPELVKVNLLCELYRVTCDYLITGVPAGGGITSVEAVVEEIDWTAAWSKRYPILASYQGMRGIEKYREKIRAMYEDCKSEFSFSDADAVLVLKDILYQTYQSKKKK